MTTENTVPNPETPEMSDPYRNNLQIYLIPGWIYQAFTAKYNLMEIHNYGKLRGVLSLLDVAHLEIIRTLMFPKSRVQNLNQDDFSWTLKSFINDCTYGAEKDNLATDAEQAEIESTVRYLVRDPEVIQEALGRLSKVDTCGLRGCEAVDNFRDLQNQKLETEAPLYRLVNSQDKLYIIVEEGFLSQMEDTVNLKAFLTQVLKSAYAMAPIPVVNSTLWYEQFLKVLAAEA